MQLVYASVRARGHVLVCAVVLVAIAIAIVGGWAETDPTGWRLLGPAGGLVIVVALIARMPRVGLQVRDGVLYKRGWARTRVVAVSQVRRVDIEGYSGGLNRGAISRLTVMPVLYLHDGCRIEVPELMSRAKNGAVMAGRVRAVLGLDAERSPTSRQTQTQSFEGECARAAVDRPGTGLLRLAARAVERRGGRAHSHRAYAYTLATGISSLERRTPLSRQMGTFERSPSECIVMQSEVSVDMAYGGSTGGRFGQHVWPRVCLTMCPQGDPESGHRPCSTPALGRAKIGGQPRRPGAASCASQRSSPTCT